jgi:hypothetical protein
LLKKLYAFFLALNLSIKKILTVNDMNCVFMQNSKFHKSGTMIYGGVIYILSNFLEKKPNKLYFKIRNKKIYFIQVFRVLKNNSISIINCEFFSPYAYIYGGVIQIKLNLSIATPKNMSLIGYFSFILEHYRS